MRSLLREQADGERVEGAHPKLHFLATTEFFEKLKKIVVKMEADSASRIPLALQKYDSISEAEKCSLWEINQGESAGYGSGSTDKTTFRATELFAVTESGRLWAAVAPPHSESACSSRCLRRVPMSS